MLDLDGLKTTYGSLLYKDNVPEADDAMVASVRGEGAVFIGKTNSPEFGAGAQTTNRVYGTTGNPFDPLKTCAGSSGGSAVALATGQAVLATGSDYGGSLRTPAAFCGVVGFRPSPGMVPSGTRAVSLNPFSVLGPMGRSVADAHLLLKAQIDIDRADPFAGDDCLRIPDQLQGADLGSVRAVCDRAVWLDEGRVQADGPVDAVLGDYREDVEAREPIDRERRGLVLRVSDRGRSGEVRNQARDQSLRKEGMSGARSAVRSAAAEARNPEATIAAKVTPRPAHGTLPGRASAPGKIARDALRAPHASPAPRSTYWPMCSSRTRSSTNRVRATMAAR